MFWAPLIGAGIGGLTSLLRGDNLQNSLINMGIGGGIGAATGYGMDKWGSTLLGKSPATMATQTASKVPTQSALENATAQAMGQPISRVPSQAALEGATQQFMNQPKGGLTPMDYGLMGMQGLNAVPRPQPRPVQPMVASSGVGGGGSYHPPIVPPNPYANVMSSPYRSMLTQRLLGYR